MLTCAHIGTHRQTREGAPRALHPVCSFSTVPVLAFSVCFTLVVTFQVVVDKALGRLAYLRFVCASSLSEVSLSLALYRAQTRTYTVRFFVPLQSGRICLDVLCFPFRKIHSAPPGDSSDNIVRAQLWRDGGRRSNRKFWIFQWLFFSYFFSWNKECDGVLAGFYTFTINCNNWSPRHY